MKINDMDKYQVTKAIEWMKKILSDPELQLFDFPRDVYEEIMNPVTDKDGYVHKYYLSDVAKDIIELFLEKFR